MKRTPLFAIAIVSLLMAGTTACAWSIVSHDVDITVGADGSMDVLEKIHVDFGTEKRHGIFRVISMGSGAKRLTIDVRGVTNEKNAARKAQVVKGKKEVRITIGDPAILISGVQHYHIRYHATGAVVVMGGGHRLHWNAIGNNWGDCREIGPSVIIVKPPAGMKPTDTRAAISLGNGDMLGEYIIAQENWVGTIRFSVNRALRPDEGVTILIEFPKGAIRRPTSRPATRPARTTSRPATRDSLKEDTTK